MQEHHQNFFKSARKHVFMVTNHGVHEWEVVPGLTDTGGQNVFVNQFAEELVAQGYKVTIANRGGYPHPVTGAPHNGMVYNGDFQRIIYLEDGLQKFVRKEDMGDQVEQLAAFLTEFLKKESLPVDMIISHYWDAAVVAEMSRRAYGHAIPHIWVPHSLGALKKRNVSPERWEDLRIDERIQAERDILTQVDRVASTSPIISQALKEEYGYQKALLWLPPCVSTARYHPRCVTQEAPVWQVLSAGSGLTHEEIGARKIITEISRTDSTKRKDVLLKAYARIVEKFHKTLLVVSIEEEKEPLGPELMKLIDTLGLRGHVAVLGSVWDLLPDIYALTDIYCTPSVVEGFGMSAQEAAATAVPVVASRQVPFATQYLHGEPLVFDEHAVSMRGGAMIVQPDDVGGFAEALALLLSDDALRVMMGNKAFETTVPRFTWPKVVENFMEEV